MSRISADKIRNHLGLNSVACIVSARYADKKTFCDISKMSWITFFNIKSWLKRSYSTTAADLAIKPYADIPGPRGPFGLGSLYKYLPVIGEYSWLALDKASLDKYEKYGGIVRETIVPGQDIVWLFDPNDIAKLLNERTYPQRRSHLALEKFRIDRPHIYRSAGLLPTNGCDWWRLRSEFQKEMSTPNNVRSFLPDVDKVMQEFVDSLPIGETFNIAPQLSRLNLELTCLLTFGVRLNSFSAEEASPDSRSSRIMRAAETTNACILPTDQGLQLWRYFETPTYRKLRIAQEYMESVAIDLVMEKEKSNRSENAAHCDTTLTKRDSLIEVYLKNPKLNLQDVVGIAADLLLAGIDTTSYTMGFATYHIAKNGKVQEQLFKEAQQVIESENSSINVDAMRSNIGYTRAVLKEVMRINPISVGVGRILNNDLVLSGYHVPKGTVVVTQNMIACRLEKYFQDPLKFLPERWLERKQDVNPYLVIPFGHGMRACIARRLAEQSMLVFILRLIRHFEITWAGCDSLDVRTLLINKPSEPVLIQLQPRKQELKEL